MSKSLELHKNSAKHHDVDVSWKIEKDTIHFHFIVSHYKPHQDKKFGTDYQDNWGLWDFDVVEVFLQKDDSESYLEFQSSPLGQPFALIVEKPREKFHAPKSFNYTVENKVTDKLWESSLTVDLEDIPGSSSRIIGNCFACLGPKESREYFALNINQEDNPDFHRPDLFVDLGGIS